jgi:2-polyprenyl-3-methyl-5-hydroxy-6-metoxy-1,4-benzoquinol methylase
MDSSKLLPENQFQRFEELRKADMQEYSDPETGKLRSDYGTPVTNCPSCGTSTDSSEYIFTKEAFDYSQCNNCELVYVNPRLNDKYTARLYQEGRCLEQLKTIYLPTAKYRQETVYLRKLKEIEDMTPARNLLDFGSSTGYFMKTAQDRGWKVSGVELNPFGVSWAREELGLDNVYNKDIGECGFSEGQFDVITLWDVLEHIAEPAPLLKQLSKYLSKDGHMIIETSHYDCLETDILGKENTNIVGDMHIMHFTETSLAKLLNRTGLKVIDSSIFGLDLQHIINYEKVHQLDNFRIPQESLNQIQACIDQAKKGCYIKVTAQLM